MDSRDLYSIIPFISSPDFTTNSSSIYGRRCYLWMAMPNTATTTTTNTKYLTAITSLLPITDTYKSYRYR